jgi:hypothetical protein
MEVCDQLEECKDVRQADIVVCNQLEEHKVVRQADEGL